MYALALFFIFPFIMNIKLFSTLAFFSIVQLCSAQVDQTFRFVDEEGNEVPDGAVVTIRDITLDDWDGETEMMVIPLSVENVSGNEAAVGLYEDIDAIPNGTWETCALGNCKYLDETGYSSKSIVEGDYNEPIDTEWLPEGGEYPVWEATLQIHVFNIVEKSSFGVITLVPGDEVIGYGPKVTVRFAYGESDDPSAIYKHEAPTILSQTVGTQWYDLTGRKLSSRQSGQLIIVRLPNGQTKKML